jgi:Glycosyltransferase family 87
MTPEQQPALVTETKSNRHPILFTLLVLIVLFNVKLLWITKDNILEGYGDFASFYASALIVREGRGNELYNYNTQREIQRPLFPTVETREDALPYVHMAYETLIYVPLTFLSYSKAIGLWMFINLFMLVMVSVCLPLHPPFQKKTLRISLLLSMLASFPVLVTLIQGQDCIILLLLYSLAFICLKKDSPALAGCILAFGLFKFQLVLPFVGIFLLERQWKFVSGFVAASIVPIITSLYIAGTGGTLEYIRFLVRFSQSPLGQFEIEPSKMPNIRGILFTVLSGLLSHRLLFIATVIGSIAIVVWAIRTSRSAPLEVRFALAMLVSLSVSYYLMVYDLALAVLPLIIMINQMSSITSHLFRFYQSTFVILCALLLMSPSHLAILSYGIAPSLMALPLLGLIFLTGKQHSIPFASTKMAPIAIDTQP